MLSAQYDQDFYDQQMSGSYRSAQVFAGILASIMVPRSVADLGCGRGTWLKAFGEVGARKLVGFDGAWNRQENMVDGSIVFNPWDLNKSICWDPAEKFDLAVSLEVAEHLEPASAPSFVSSLASLSDLVLFSAAFPGQGGTHHINERPHSYWASLFAAHAYVPFDVFRPIVWGDQRVEFWYRRNAFLYARTGSVAYRTLRSKGLLPISTATLMDCVEPRSYLARLPMTRKLRLSPRVARILFRHLFNSSRKSV